MESNNDDSLNFNVTEYTDKVLLMKDFIQNNLLGFKSFRERNYNNARKAYKKCLGIASKRGEEEMKVIESNVNYGVSLFFTGKYSEAKKHFEEAFKLSKKLFDDQIYSEIILQ